ncbi:MAG: tRNA lysidine(34) synthetase TilS [Corynebacterium sp.]|uniref:tRNA lysidine(34) synthetase TilS n=1 Tax=Corynebacterium sp. TaxID=1720 RepID=UPI003F979EB8
MIRTPRTLAVRRSLGRFLDDHPDLVSPGDPVVCGVSGGGDSLALAAACVHAGLEVTTVTVDHGLQDGSADVAATAADICRQLGADSVIATVNVAGRGEAAARDARYTALGEHAHGRPVLVAHTADDDAEGLLLALARGSGTGSLAGLREVSHDHHAVTAGASWLGRPLLHATRDDTLGSCAELGLEPWHDPHNESPDIVRARVRHELLPLVRDVLGEGSPGNLARSARMLRQDADLLHAMAQEVLDGIVRDDRRVLPVEDVENQPAALRRRVLRLWLADLAGPLTSAHLVMLDALVSDWHGQGPVAVPYPAAASARAQASTMGVTRRLVVRRRRTDTGSQLEIAQTAGVENR